MKGKPKELSNRQRDALGRIYEFCERGGFKYFGYNTFNGIGRKTIDVLKAAGLVTYYEYPNLFKMTDSGISLCKNGAVRLPAKDAIDKLNRWNKAAQDE